MAYAATIRTEDVLLRDHLEGIVRRYQKGYLATDPVMFPHRYQDVLDQEVVALLSAALAYGRVASIQKSVEDVLARLGPHPGSTIRKDKDPRSLRARLRGFRHRFNSGDDIAFMLFMIGEAIRNHGSLGAAFAAGFSSGDADVAAGLARFVETLWARAEPGWVKATRKRPSSSARYLLSSPTAGSACKRMFLFLRWMVRPADGVDLGLWTFVEPKRLLVPLDTHVFRIARNLGLTCRKTANLRTAREVTAGLALLNPEDPVRYDFALSRLGILDECPSRRQELKCKACDLYSVCQL